MKQWIFEHIILKLFDKQFGEYLHTSLTIPLQEPLPDNWMDNISDDEMNEICKSINKYAKKELLKTH